MRFGRYQLGPNPNRASFFVRVKDWEIIADNLSKTGWLTAESPTIVRERPRL